MKPLRLGFVAPEFPPSAGGVQTYSVAVATEFARRGHDIRVFAPHGAIADGFPFRVEPQLRLRTYADLPRLRAELPDLWHGFNAGCAWLVQLGRPLTLSVHGNDFVNAYSPFARLDLKERGRLPFGSRLDDVIGRRLARWRQHRDLPRVGHVFANSRHTLGRLEQAHPGCRGRASCTGVGVSAHFFASSIPARRPGRARLLTAARFDEPRKNLPLLLRALGNLPKGTEFELSVIGDGAQRPTLEALAREVGLEDRVRFTGRVPDERLVAELRDADLFILTPAETPRSFEGFGLVYLEANAAGTPVLAARTGGVPEAVEEGISGFFVDALTEAAVAHAILRFLRGEIGFDRLRCRKHAEHYTWSRVVDRIEPAMVELVANASRTNSARAHGEG